MESRVQEALTSFPAPTTSTTLETMEHLALLRRWYYRSSRVGEIFFADEKGALPMRRLVRGIRESIAARNQKWMHRDSSSRIWFR